MKNIVYLVFAFLLIITTSCGNNSIKNFNDEPSSETEGIQMKYEIEIDHPIPENGPGIIKVYKQSVPAMRFIGYNNGSGQHPDWGTAWGLDVFGKIEQASGGEEASHLLYEDADAYIGMYYRNEETGGYDGWVGMFASPGTEVPEGLSYIDFPEQNFGVCWLYGIGDWPGAYELKPQVPDVLKAAGMVIKSDEKGYIGHFERDLCPRFTTPDEKGNIIIDYIYFVE